MKKTIFTLIALLGAIVASAQSNTFPATGNVGIGTVSPASPLEVRGIARFGNATDYGWIFAGNSGGLNAFHVGSFTNVPVAFFTNASAPKMTLDVSGNLGIGTTTPAYPLSLGTALGNKIALYDAAGGNGYGFGIQNNLLQIFANTAADRVGIGYGNSASFSETLTVKGANVGIGTTSPTHKLSVNGAIRAKEVIVENTGWADHVFAADYRLAPLSEVEQHIQQNGHLPDVPSAADVAVRGVSVGEMQKILLQKIEELTLHQIEQEKRLNSQAERIRTLETENAQLRTR